MIMWLDSNRLSRFFCRLVGRQLIAVWCWCKTARLNQKFPRQTDRPTDRHALTSFISSMIYICIHFDCLIQRLCCCWLDCEIRWLFCSFSFCCRSFFLLDIYVGDAYVERCFEFLSNFSPLAHTFKWTCYIIQNGLWAHRATHLHMSIDFSLEGRLIPSRRCYIRWQQSPLDAPQHIY